MLALGSAFGLAIPTPHHNDHQQTTPPAQDKRVLQPAATGAAKGVPKPRQPTKHEESTAQRAKDIKDSLKRTASSRHHMMPHGSNGKRESETDSSPTCVSMDNYWNAQYTVSVSIGNPPQKIQVVPDTGSFALVLDSSLCDSVGCQAHHQFTPAHSHTYLNGTEADFDIEYGQGGVLVHPARDSVALGDAKKNNISLLLMVRETLEYFDEAAFEGVMGLGHNKYAETGGEALLTEYGVDTFGVCLGQADGSKGRLDLSQEIPQLKGKYHDSLKVVGRVHWGVSLSGITVRGEKLKADESRMMSFGPDEPLNKAEAKLDEEQPARVVADADADADAKTYSPWSLASKASNHSSVCGSGGCGAILDSGTSLLTVPEATLDAIYDAIGLEDLFSLSESKACKGALYEALPEISFSLDGTPVTLHPADYMASMEVDNPAESLHSFHAELISKKGGIGAIKPAAPFSFKARSAAKPSDGEGEYAVRCIPLFGSLDSMTDHGPLYILGMPLFRAFAAKFDRHKRTISLAKVEQRNTCAGCPGGGSLAAHHQQSNLASTSKKAEPPREPVRVSASKLRLPWWAVDPNLRPQGKGGVASGKRVGLVQNEKKAPWMITL